LGPPFTEKSDKQGRKGHPTGFKKKVKYFKEELATSTWEKGVVFQKQAFYQGTREKPQSRENAESNKVLWEQYDLGGGAKSFELHPVLKK